MTIKEAIMQPPMENQTPVPVSKKLKSMLRVIFFMLRKGKKRLMLDLKVAGKTLFGDHVTSTAGAARVYNYAGPPPEEYEFSCSKTPAHRSLLLSLHLIGGKKGKSEHKALFEDALETMSLNDVTASPGLPVPWTGGNGDCGVDAAADEFFRRFYSQLRRQPLADA